MDHLKLRVVRYTLICSADRTPRDFFCLDGYAAVLAGILLDRLRNYHSSPHPSNARAHLVHLQRLNYGGKANLFKGWIKCLDRMLPALICAKLSIGSCSFAFHRKIKKVRDFHEQDGHPNQKLVHDRALIMAFNCHKCYNAYVSSDQLSVDDILNYDVYDALNRLREKLKKHGVFSYDYLEQTGDNVMNGLPFQVFLLLDSFLPYKEWRYHLCETKALVTPTEMQAMHNNILFHKLK